MSFALGEKYEHRITISSNDTSFTYRSSNHSVVCGTWTKTSASEGRPVFSMDGRVLGYREGSSNDLYRYTYRIADSLGSDRLYAHGFGGAKHPVFGSSLQVYNGSSYQFRAVHVTCSTVLSSEQTKTALSSWAAAQPLSPEIDSQQPPGVPPLPAQVCRLLAIAKVLPQSLHAVFEHCIHTALDLETAIQHHTSSPFIRTFVTANSAQVASSSVIQMMGVDQLLDLLPVTSAKHQIAVALRWLCDAPRALLLCTHAEATEKTLKDVLDSGLAAALDSPTIVEGLRCASEAELLTALGCGLPGFAFRLFSLVPFVVERLDVDQLLDLVKATAAEHQKAVVTRWLTDVPRALTLCTHAKASQQPFKDVLDSALTSALNSPAVAESFLSQTEADLLSALGCRLQGFTAKLCDLVVGNAGQMTLGLAGLRGLVDCARRAPIVMNSVILHYSKTDEHGRIVFGDSQNSWKLHFDGDARCWVGVLQLTKSSTAIPVYHVATKPLAPMLGGQVCATNFQQRADMRVASERYGRTKTVSNSGNPALDGVYKQVSYERSPHRRYHYHEQDADTELLHNNTIFTKENCVAFQSSQGIWHVRVPTAEAPAIVGRWSKAALLAKVTLWCFLLSLPEYVDGVVGLNSAKPHPQHCVNAFGRV